VGHSARRRLPSRGSLGPRCPPSTVLGDATTATVSRSGCFAWRSRPDTLRAPSVRGFPDGLVPSGEAPQITPGPVVTRSPTPGLASRRQRARPRSRVPPLKTCPALRPRWCPAHSPSRVHDCCLPATGHRRLSPPYHREGSPAVHDDTNVWAPSRGLSPRDTRLRTASYGEARGFAPDRLARRSSGRTCTLRCAPTGEPQPISWTCVHSQGFGLTLARAACG
jgi:hypothetical protein